MNEEGICPLTRSKAQIQNHHSLGYVFYTSTLCGPYALSNDVERMVRHDRYVDAQGLINCAGRSIEINEHDADTYAYWVNKQEYQDLAKGGREPPKGAVPISFEDCYEEDGNHADKPYQLLELLAKRLERHRAFMDIPITASEMLKARICDVNELESHVNHLSGMNPQLVHREKKQFKPEHPNDILVRMTVDGWAEIRKRYQGKRSNRVFVAMQFHWDDESLRIEAYKAIRQACRDCGYEASTVGQDHTGSITDRIVSEIKKSKFVVAELSYNNRGVYFESGFARGQGMDVFHVIHKDHVDGSEAKGRKIHFDIAQVQYRKWSSSKHLREVLRDWIQATVGSYTK